MNKGKSRKRHIEGVNSVLACHTKDGKKTRHTKMCAACELNCEVRHVEVGFWARVDGLSPVYSIRNCPKQTRSEVLGIKRPRR